MTTTYLMDNIDEVLLNEFKELAKKMGRDIFIRPVGETMTNKNLPPFNQALEKLPKSDDNDDFFVRDYIDTGSREIDWSE